MAMCLFVGKFGKAEDSGRVLDLKILHRMSRSVHDIDVHHGFGIVTATGEEQSSCDTGKNRTRSRFHADIVLWMDWG